MPITQYPLQNLTSVQKDTNPSYLKEVGIRIMISSLADYKVMLK
jgi:hypothetical protein